MLTLASSLTLTPSLFAKMCASNPEAVLEPAAKGSIRSPNASVLRLERWQALGEAERARFPPLYPDLVVELASPADAAQALRRKMAE